MIWAMSWWDVRGHASVNKGYCKAVTAGAAPDCDIRAGRKKAAVIFKDGDYLTICVVAQRRIVGVVRTGYCVRRARRIFCGNRHAE